MEPGSDKDLERRCKKPPYGVMEQDWSGPGKRTVEVLNELKSRPFNERKISNLEKAKIRDHLDDQKTFFRRQKQKKEVEELLQQTFIEKQNKLAEFEENIDVSLDMDFYYRKANEYLLMRIKEFVRPRYQEAFKTVIDVFFGKEMTLEAAVEKYWVKPKVGSRRTFFNYYKEVLNA